VVRRFTDRSPRQLAWVTSLVRALLEWGAAIDAVNYRNETALILAAAQTYGDATEAAYGERLPVARMSDDDGGALDAYSDDHLYTWDWVLALLAMPAAIAHSAWPDLVIELCDAKQAAVGSYSFGDEEIATLLGVPEATAHPRYPELVGVARAAFPFARCFGASGALRDFKAAPRTTLPARPTSSAAAAPKKAAPKRAGPKKAAPKKKR